jgi:hypothetical protein
MTSRLGLQIVLGLLSAVPLVFGALGTISGAPGLNGAAAVTAGLDSQFRFLSGLYLGLAGIVWYIIPRIERETTLFAIIIGSIFLGGLARVVSWHAFGLPPSNMIAGLILELMVPALIPWQRRLARTAKP